MMVTSPEPAAPTGDAAASRLKCAVLVASRGRPEVLAQLLSSLARQTRRPDQVVLSVTSSADLPRGTFLAFDCVMGAAGSCEQRNRGLDAIRPDVDVIAFFDDDYVPRRDAIEGLAGFFADHPGVAAANGRLVADGVNGPGLSFDEAERLLAASYAPVDLVPQLRRAEGLYGCHMAFRACAIGEVRFDENLPLNGWQEDIDFSARVGAQGGDLVVCDAFVGVHRGVKGARVSGVRFGYSQVVNPAYLARKGTMRRGYALKIAARNVLANLVRCLRPEPWADRAGRLRGNLKGLLDLVTGRLNPRRILDV